MGYTQKGDKKLIQKELVNYHDRANVPLIAYSLLLTPQLLSDR